MKYESHINSAFEKLNFCPRPGQPEAINQILEAFLDEKMTNVILNAPTGIGKSIIGAVAAEALSTALGIADSSPKAAIMLTATNALSKQYHDTFDTLQKQNKFIMIKGANNYECAALTTNEEPATGEMCAYYTMVQHAKEFERVIENTCDRCEYLKIKKQKNSTRYVTTNYSYYFIDRMYTGKFEDRSLIVWDEAHLINDLFSEHNAIFFSQKLIQRMAQEIADVIQLTDIEIANILKSVANDCGIKNKINEKNYTSYLNALLKVYRYAKERGTIAQERALRAGKTSAYNRLTKFIKAYEGKACKIDDFFKYGYDHVFEYKEDDKSVSIKPIFIGKMLEALQCSKFNLFMSATISEDFALTTLNLDKTKTKFIKLPAVFPKENKQVIFFDPLSLNYESMKDPATIKKLIDNIRKIVKKHSSSGERGIILAPSFKLTQAIAEGIKSPDFKIFEHRQGEKLENVLSAFKAYSSGPAVMLSPSMFEGIDFSDDLSRFQILVKAPFPSLGDKRMKYVLDHHPNLYSLITIMKAVQGAGRSVRSQTDYATTYILDKHLSRLWTSKQNIWKDEFSTSFTSFL